MTKKLWGGRFKKEIDKDFFRFQQSIDYDYKLAEYDIMHSLIHVGALNQAGILTADEADKLSAALKIILKEVKLKKFIPDPEAEDIHADIQSRVQKLLGKLADKLHSLRSRNDQVVFGERLYCLAQSRELLEQLSKLKAGMLSLAARYKHMPFPGYTHTQRAQVIPFGHYLVGFICGFERDMHRLNKFHQDLFVYIGSAALAGSALKTSDYDKAIKQCVINKDFLGKIKPAISCLDNVSDRDFIIELLSILSLVQTHLSRLAQDLILYSTKEFDFLELPEEFCTGSSLMPHKKNPDFLELVRGSSGRIYGNLVSLLVMMKGLPLAYNRDMQLDKEPLFSSIEVVKDELEIFSKLLKGIKLKKENINQALEDECLYATEFAEFLVFKGVAFKDAHDIIGRLVRHCEDKKIKIKDMSDKALKNFCGLLSAKDIKKIMEPGYAVSSKNK